jgi:general secretion pathway protein A
VASSLTFDQFFSFFGLRENPFHVSPDPRFYYSSPGHDTAFSELLYSIQTRQGMTVLTGEAGTGKTTLVNRLLDWLRERNLSSAYVFHSLLRPSDLFEFIARDFGIPCASSDKGALIDALHKWLVRRHSASDTPVVIIDEAQALSTNTLDELRLLLNLETSGGKLIHIVLVGQPELDVKLQRHQLRQLRQRIMFRCRLPLLSSEQTGNYIATRLSAAGAGAAESNLFPRETVRVLHGYSRGIPRVINLLCEHALLAAYSDRHHSISPADIHCAAAKFDLVHDPIPAEDVFPMSTRMALFLSPDPPATEASAPVESQQTTQQNVQQVTQEVTQHTTEILPIFPVPAPVLLITESILSLTPQLAGEPDPAPAPISDPPPADVPPTPSEPPIPISEPNPPVEEDVVAEIAIPSMNSALVNSTLVDSMAMNATPANSTPVNSTLANPAVDATRESPVISAPRRVMFGPKRMATTMERQAATPTPARSAPDQAAASNRTALPDEASSPTHVVSRNQVAPNQLTSPAEFAKSACANLAVPKVEHEVSRRLASVPAKVSLAPKKQAPAARPVSQISVQLAVASEQLAAASRQVASASKQIAVASKQLALASKRIIPPNVGASISRYCRGVADSFVRDLRLWIKPSSAERRANPQPSVATPESDGPAVESGTFSTATDPSRIAPPESPAATQKVVVSISKWLREPMAPSLQSHERPNPSRKSRIQPANKPPPRSAQKS